MEKIQVKLVLLGHLRHTLNLKKLRRFKSKFFKITELERITELPEPQKDDGYLDIVYSREEIRSILRPVTGSDIVLGIINYRFDDGFYLHRSEGQKACLSIAEVDSVLLQEEISIENFILKNVFELVAFGNIFGGIPGDEVYHLVHQDTRGCLFDLNGDKYDIAYNTEKPTICNACKAFINRKSVPQNFVNEFERELKKIKKPFICSVELFIKKYPLLSVLITFLGGIIINMISNGLWEILSK